MENTISSTSDLKVGAIYSRTDVLKLEVKSLNNRNMNYLKLKKGLRVYFFEKTEEGYYRLFEIISNAEHTKFV